MRVQARAAWRSALDDEMREVALEEASKALLEGVPPTKPDKKGQHKKLLSVSHSSSHSVTYVGKGFDYEKT
jgi:hypothetical protein